MKRSLFLLLATLLAFGTLTACSDDDDEEPTADVIDDTSVDTTDTDDSTDDGETIEPLTNACSDAINEAAFTAYATTAGDDCDSPGGLAADAATQECDALNCAGGDCTEAEIQVIVDCIVTSVAATTGIDDDCGSCYGTLAACVIANCALKCAGGTDAPACVTCIQENGCNTELETCSGLDAEFSPCP